jgi:hypothetical protein
MPVDHPSAYAWQPASLHPPTSDIALADNSLSEDASEGERVGDCHHSQPSSGNDGKRKISFFMGNLHGFSEKLVLQGLLAHDSLELPDAPLKGFDL